MKLATRGLIQLFLVIALLAVGGGVLYYFTISKPPLAKKPTRKEVPLVRVMKAENLAISLDISGEGTVRPVSGGKVSVQVAGRVAWVSPKLLVGGSLAEDELILKIEPTDFELAVKLARAQVEDAEARLEQANEENASALEEWQTLGFEGSPPPLVAKTPQLEAAGANLEAANARLQQAELDLSRCSIKSPYACRVVSKSADLGQYLAKGAVVAQLYSVAAMEIPVNLDDRDLAWLEIPGMTTKSDQGSTALVMADFAGQTLTWQGEIHRAEAEIDPKTRLVPVVIRVDDPASRMPPLSPGMFARVVMRGSSLNSATVIPREALRKDDTIWLLDDESRLRFHKVKVARYDRDKVVLSPGLKPGSLIVLSFLRAVTEGMKLDYLVADQTVRAE